MNITEYTEYILWAGGALIALVMAHGLWMNWRGRSSRNRVEQTPLEPAEQMNFEFDPQAGVLDGVVDPASHGILSQQGDHASESENREGAAIDDGVPVEAGAPSKFMRQGRRIPIPGRRTEPTVPRNVRTFANGVDAHATVPLAEPPAVDEEVADIVVIWILAKDGAVFDGQSLLQAFMASDLKYVGNVFRKLDPNTRKTMFTVANGVEPGTFDLSDMESLATPRVVFLLRLAGMSDPRAAFEELLEVAQEVAVSVGGELKDERKNDLSGQTIEHYRQRIRDFKRVNMRP